MRALSTLLPHASSVLCGVAALMISTGCKKDAATTPPPPDAGQAQASFHGPGKGVDRTEDTEASYIYWGDNHTHTRYSTDAWLAIADSGELSRTGKDVTAACEFARFCSDLDFFVSSDHAEMLTDETWRRIRSQVVQCNAEVTPEDEFVAYAGFEWSQNPVTPGASPNRYGHRVVHFLGDKVDDDAASGRKNVHATPKPIASSAVNELQITVTPECSGRQCRLTGDPIVWAVQKASAAARTRDSADTRFYPLQEFLALPTLPSSYRPECGPGDARPKCSLPFCNSALHDPPTRECRTSADCCRDPGEAFTEHAREPRELFEKLDRWVNAPCAAGDEALCEGGKYVDRDVVVGAHGTAWGLGGYAEFSQDYTQEDHWPRYEKYFEVYSKHGSSESFAQLPPDYVTSAGEPCNPSHCGDCTCAPPQGAYTPCCHQCGELLMSECRGVRCNDAIVAAASCRGATSCSVLRTNEQREWLDCGQCPPDQCPFQPAKGYYGRGSVQAALAVRLRETAAVRDRPYYETGFIAATDTHEARPGSTLETIPFAEITQGKALDFVSAAGAPHVMNNNYWFAGGLVAVHVPKEVRDGDREDLRHQVFDAFKEQHVYATSGDRIKLWFYRKEGSADAEHMGQVKRGFTGRPAFRVRAVGAWRQADGDACAGRDFEGHGFDRVFAHETCVDTCYNPDTTTREEIVRVEVVKISRAAAASSLDQCSAARPCQAAGEVCDYYCRHDSQPGDCAMGRCVADLAPLIEDPWKAFDCAGNELTPTLRQGQPPSYPAGQSAADCKITFTGDEITTGGRPVVYYVRAIQEPTEFINGDPMNCTRADDPGAPADGRCTSTEPCRPYDAVMRDEAACKKATNNERAWSSPIYLYP